MPSGPVAFLTLSLASSLSTWTVESTMLDEGAESLLGGCGKAAGMEGIGGEVSVQGGCGGAGERGVGEAVSAQGGCEGQQRGGVGVEREVAAEVPVGGSRSRAG